MAGNVSAFATVWTYDIYRPYLRKEASDAHYVTTGRWCTILGVLASIGAAYLVTQFKSIMDYMQALISFVISPLFGTVIVGMLWSRATAKGGFWGLLAGSLSSVGMFVLVKIDPSKLAWIALSRDAKDMAENLYRALWSLTICILVTVVVSLLTKPRRLEELEGLVYGHTKMASDDDAPWHRRPLFWAAGAGVVFAILQWIFW
jgi:SSS family solute:Na+ symporter